MTDVLELTRTGIELQLRGDRLGARLHYLAALCTDPQCLPALQNMGQLANDANELDAAATFVHKILHQCPNDGMQWSNLGNLLMRQEKYDDAKNALARAASMIPDVPVVWQNFGLLHLRMRQYEAALACFERAERMGLRTLGIQNDKAHALLHLGRINEAWPFYEARWATLAHLPPWDFHLPEWQGEDLRGKSILIHSEQGFGDTIMWLRFANRFAHTSMTLGVPRCMVSLVEALGHTALAIEDMNAESMQFDYHSPMYSALRWLGVSRDDISPEPYLPLPCTSSNDDRLRIGICWASGRRSTELDWRGRFSDLRDWLELATLPGVELVSLQQGRDAGDIAARSAEGLVDNTAINAARDWLATARIIANLDLVICVDTAVAHVAGALGKPVWMLAQYTNCWRWWDIENGTGRPWYKSMRIIRQPTPGDWRTPLSVCVRDLRRRASPIELLNAA
jgi:tetratricopeptide (TPR) repeat protein